MIENSTPVPNALQRRVDDMPLPGKPLYWGEDGTPLPASSVVYQYRPQADERHRLWSDITTKELLTYVQAAPERFELRTLFTVSVDDLARSPLATILEARLSMDRIEARTKKAIDEWRESQRAAVAARLRDALALLGEGA